MALTGLKRLIWHYCLVVSILISIDIGTQNFYGIVEAHIVVEDAKILLVLVLSSLVPPIL